MRSCAEYFLNSKQDEYKIFSVRLQRMAEYLHAANAVVGTAAAQSHAETQIRNPHTSDTNGSVSSCSSSLKAERTWLPLVHQRYQVHFESWWVQRRPRRSAVSCNMVCCGSPCTLQAYTRSTDGKVRSRYGEVAFNGPVSWH